MIGRDGIETAINNPADFPDSGEVIKRKISEILEPMIRATIVAPDEYTGAIMDLCTVRSSQPP